MSHALPVQQVHKKLGGSTARTADPTDQRDILYHKTSYSVCKLEGVGWQPWITAQGQAGYWSMASEQLCCAPQLCFSWVLFPSPSLSLPVLQLSYNLFFCQLLNCSYLHPRGLPVLSNSFCREEVGSEQTTVWYIVPSWVSAMPVVSLFDVCVGSAVYVFRLGICSAVLLVV